MEDDLQKNGRRPQKKRKMTSEEEKIKENLEKNENGRRPQFLDTRRQPQFLKMEDDLIFI
jgi:hypothetical protein